jgi:small subunit ribosomal protein S20
MATHVSAEKRHRQNLKRREHNQEFKALMRTTIKELRKLISERKGPQAVEKLKETAKVIYSTAAKGIIKDGAAARYVSRLSSQVHRLAQGVTAQASTATTKVKKVAATAKAKAATTKKTPSKKK